MGIEDCNVIYNRISGAKKGTSIGGQSHLDYNVDWESIPKIMKNCFKVLVYIFEKEGFVEKKHDNWECWFEECFFNPDNRKFKHRVLNNLLNKIQNNKTIVELSNRHQNLLKTLFFVFNEYKKCTKAILTHGDDPETIINYDLELDLNPEGLDYIENWECWLAGSFYIIEN